MKTIDQILDELGVPYKRHGESGLVSDGWVGILCPWCGTGTDKPGMGFPLDGFVANCWKCGRRDLAQTLAKASDKPVTRIVELLKGVRGTYTPTQPKGRYEPPNPIVPLTDRKYAGAQRLYLRHKRHLDPDEVGTIWELGAINLHAKHPWSIFIPIFHRGEPVSWVTRSIGDRPGLRYRAANTAEETMSAKRILYGQDFIRHSCVVVEGPTKCWAGGPGFVCTFGVGWTAAQLRKLAVIPNVAICFDVEEEAQRRARALARALEPFGNRVCTVVLESAAQVDEADPDEVQELRKRFLE